MRRKILLALLLLILASILAFRIGAVRELFAEYLNRPLPGQDQHKYQALVDRMGAPRYSKRGEELIIRDWFDDRRGGFFVDVGASHYQVNSNTYYLEKELGWRGIAIDALAEYERGYSKHRPATRYFTFFVSDKSDERAAFFVSTANKRLSSGLPKLARRWEHEEIEVPTITLNDLLDHAGVTRFDLLSMDIEMWEPQALAGFDIERFSPELVCIEAHHAVRDAIATYFANHGYERIEKYVPYDPGNWYFTPKQ